jgi:acyl-CoA thioesterase
LIKGDDSIVQKDQFARLVGVEIIDVKPGRARLKLPVRPHHLNGIGIVQGGAMFTLADTAFAAACNSRGATTVAIHADISFVKAARGPVLWAEAVDIKDAKVGVYEVKVMEGDDSGGKEIVAVFQGVSYQLKPQPAKDGR